MHVSVREACVYMCVGVRRECWCLIGLWVFVCGEAKACMSVHPLLHRQRDPRLPALADSTGKKIPLAQALVRHSDIWRPRT